MCADHPTSPRHHQRATRQQTGVSLVEVMVGMVVALIISLAASGSATLFGASQRQGVGTAGATVNASTALAAIKGDVASAGLGFFGDSNFQCHTLNLGVGTTAMLDGASFAPVRVTSGSGNQDLLDVLYASNVDSGANVLMKGSSNGSSARLMSRMPVAVGDAVLLAPATAGTACIVRSVTAVTAATSDTPLTLDFANTGHHNAAIFTTVANFADRDRVALLGTLEWSRYDVSGNVLRLTRPLATGNFPNGAAANSPVTLVRNVMAFRVQYGVVGTAPGDTTLTGWQDATDTPWASVAGTAVDRVRALRIGMVTRSEQREKPDSSGNCVASTAKPVLFGVTVDPDVSDWACYRYRVATVVVPLRNAAW
jgi:type IV pilus assembly protein PilW